MPEDRSGPVRVQTQPGKASAEGGFVVLDGPDGIAITMTASAAIGTGHTLITAAEMAKRQLEDPFDPANSFGEDGI